MPSLRFGIVIEGYDDKSTREYVPIWHVHYQSPGRPATKTRPKTFTEYGPTIASFTTRKEANAKRALYNELRKQGLPIEAEPHEIALTQLCEQKKVEWENRWQDCSLWTAKSLAGSPDPSPSQKILLSAVADFEYYLSSDNVEDAFQRVDTILETILETLAEEAKAKTTNRQIHRTIRRTLHAFSKVMDQSDELAWRSCIEDMCDCIAFATDELDFTEIGELIIAHYETLSKRYDQREVRHIQS